MNADENQRSVRAPNKTDKSEYFERGSAQIDSLGSIQDSTAKTANQASDLQEVSRDLKCLSELRFPIGLDSVPPDDIYDHSPGRYCNYIWNSL